MKDTTLYSPAKCMYLIILLLIGGYTQTRAQQDGSKIEDNIKVSVRLTNIKGIDTVTLFYWPHVISEISLINRYMPHLVRRTMLNDEGTASFKLSGIHSPGYLSIGLNKDPEHELPRFILNKYLSIPGDSILIQISKNDHYTNNTAQRMVDKLILQYNLGFSGRGATKYKCRFAADRKAATGSSIGHLVFNNKLKYNDSNQWDVSLRRALSVINNYKDQLKPFSYEVLQADFIGKFEYKKYQDFYLVWTLNRNDSLLLNLLEKVYRNKLRSMGMPSVKNEAAIFSNYYSSYLFYKTKVDLAIKGIPRDSGYYYLKSEYKGEVRDKVLTIFLLNWYKYFSGLQSELNDALSLVAAPYCLNQLIELHNALSIGNPAYDFTLPNISGKMISLSDFIGKVVFIDFWFTGCTSCLGYYQHTVSKVEKQFKDNSDVVFVSISIDGSKSRWMSSVRSGKYTSPTASNVINLYAGMGGYNNEVTRHYKITGYPMPLLIDKEGKIYRKSVENLGSKGMLIQNIREALKKKVCD